MEDLASVQALVQVQDDEKELFNVLKSWLDDPKCAKWAGEQGQILTCERAGADRQQFKMIKSLLGQ